MTREEEVLAVLDSYIAACEYTGVMPNNPRLVSLAVVALAAAKQERDDE